MPGTGGITRAGGGTTIDDGGGPEDGGGGGFASPYSNPGIFLLVLSRGF